MKLLLVLGSDKTYKTIAHSFKPLGFELIRYRHVQKAMDNIEEVDPEGIIVSAKDFPRHWKPLVSFVRSGRPKNICPIVVLKGDAFPEEENNKAAALEVNGLAAESLDNPATFEKIRNLLSKTTDDKQGTDKPSGLKAAASALRDSPPDVPPRLQGASPAMPDRSPPVSQGRFGFIFSNPADEKIVTGTVKAVSSAGLSFEPHHPDLAENLSPNTELANCSFRAGEDILSPSCTLIKTEKTISLEFLSFPQGEKEKFRQYLGA